MKPIDFEVTLGVPQDQAIDVVTEALKTEGFGVLTRIDVKATLKEKLGKEFRPYAILGACNPELAYRALSSEPRAGLMLPCNVTVEAGESGTTLIRVADPLVVLSAGNMDVDPVTVFHIVRLAETIGSIADHAENAGDMMRAMVAK